MMVLNPLPYNIRGVSIFDSLDAIVTDNLFNKKGASDVKITNPDLNNSTFPPYNMRRDVNVDASSTLNIDVAIAGFSAEQLKVFALQEILYISGRNDQKVSDDKYVYKGIASRGFELKFNIGHNSEILGAQLKDGILTVTVLQKKASGVREVPIIVHQEAGPSPITKNTELLTE